MHDLPFSIWLEMHAWVKLLVAYLWALATLRSSPFGVNAMLRPPPKLYLYSCGWADAPDHKETVSGGLVFELGSIDEDVALSGSSARDLPPAPCADPPPLILRLRGPTAQTSKEEEPWPEPDAQKSSKKVSAETARKDWESARTASTLKEHHLDKKTFFKHSLEFKKGTQQAKCKF